MTGEISAHGIPAREPTSFAELGSTADGYSNLVSAVDAVARRRRLGPEDRDELLSCAGLKLVEQGSKLLASFRGLASWRTYLEKIVDRLWVDLTYTRWGRWRPLAKARRLGSTAIELDRLVRREGLEPSVAAATVTAVRPQRGRRNLAALAGELAEQRRPRWVPLEPEDLDSIAKNKATEEGEAVAERERATLARELLAAIRAAITELPADQRRLLRLRFLEGRRGPEIARQTGLEQPEVYRQTYALLRSLAQTLEARGFDGAAVRSVTASDGAALLPAGAFDSAAATTSYDPGGSSSASG